MNVSDVSPCYENQRLTVSRLKFAGEQLPVSGKPGTFGSNKYRKGKKRKEKRMNVCGINVAFECLIGPEYESS